MKLLLVTATQIEMDRINDGPAGPGKLPGKLEITRLITGPGLMATAYEMGKILAVKQFDLAINMGVGGSFSGEIPMGSVVEVESEEISDFGAEDGDDFLTAFDIGLFQKDEFPFSNGILVNPDTFLKKSLPGLKKVRGITVNTVHGRKKSIEEVVKSLNPQVESMEGAAFFYACLKNDIPFLEIRAISNVVETRGRSGWKLAEALHALESCWKEQLIPFLSELT